MVGMLWGGPSFGEGFAVLSWLWGCQVSFRSDGIERDSKGLVGGDPDFL